MIFLRIFVLIRFEFDFYANLEFLHLFLLDNFDFAVNYLLIFQLLVLFKNSKNYNRLMGIKIRLKIPFKDLLNSLGNQKFL